MEAVATLATRHASHETVGEMINLAHTEGTANSLYSTVLEDTNYAQEMKVTAWSPAATSSLFYPRLSSAHSLRNARSSIHNKLRSGSLDPPPTTINLDGFQYLPRTNGTRPVVDSGNVGDAFVTTAY